MPEFGVTPEGFVLKRLEDILAGFVAVLSTVSDPVTGETYVPDLADENDPIVLIVNTASDELAVLWEQAELGYDQFDPLKNGGAGQSGTVQLNGITRNDGSRSTVSVTLSGTPGKAIAVGRLVSPPDGSVVFELPAATLDGGGSATVIGTATEDGAFEALAGTVVKIIRPVNGWSSVTNSLDATVGSAVESDTDLRARQASSTSLPARSIIESIYAGIIALDGVTFARAYQNKTLSTDSRGIPAKQIALIVVGGDDDEIANVLHDRVPVAETFGTTEIEITDEQNFTYTLRFSRPTPVPIFVDIEVEVIDPDLWPDNGSDLIKEAILTYAAEGASGLGITTGFDPNGYPPGESIHASSLYTPINSVPGHKILSVLVDNDVSDSILATDVVVIDWDEAPTFDTANIDITVT